MAKGQKRSNKEAKKPKQKKAAAAVPAGFDKGLSTPIGISNPKSGSAGSRNRSKA